MTLSKKNISTEKERKPGAREEEGNSPTQGDAKRKARGSSSGLQLKKEKTAPRGGLNFRGKKGESCPSQHARSRLVSITIIKKGKETIRGEGERRNDEKQKKSETHLSVSRSKGEGGWQAAEHQKKKKGAFVFAKE